MFISLDSPEKEAKQVINSIYGDENMSRLNEDVVSPQKSDAPLFSHTVKPLSPRDVELAECDVVEVKNEKPPSNVPLSILPVIQRRKTPRTTLLWVHFFTGLLAIALYVGSCYSPWVTFQSLVDMKTTSTVIIPGL